LVEDLNRDLAHRYFDEESRMRDLRHGVILTDVTFAHFLEAVDHWFTS